MHCKPYVIGCLTLLLPVIDIAVALPLRWNVGADQTWIDEEGNSWEADGFSSGTFSSQMCETTLFAWSPDAELACSYKEWGSVGGTSGALEIPVSDGPSMYELKLYFSDSRGIPGSRVLDVSVEGTLVFPKLDVGSRSAASLSTLTITYPVVDGSLTLEIKARTGRPLLSGLEVDRLGPIAFSAVSVADFEPKPVSSPPRPPSTRAPTPTTAVFIPWASIAPVSPTAAATALSPMVAPTASGSSPIFPISFSNTVPQGTPPQFTFRPAPTGPPLPGASIWRVNMGASQAATDASGNVWAPDTTISTGEPVTDCGQQNNQYILVCAYRAWPFTDRTGSMEFPVARGRYLIRLFFGETSEASAGERVVDIYLEGILVYRSLDVAKELGGMQGTFTYEIKQYISDGSVSLEVVATTGTPVLSAVEIVPTARRQLRGENGNQ